MAKLPTPYAERPTPRFGGRLQVPQVPDSGISQLGSAIAGFGEVLVREQLKDDKYKYEDAITRLEAGILVLKNGKQEDPDDEGYKGILGANIEKDFYGVQTKRYSDLVTDISDSLGNENQREMFARRSDEIANRFNGNLIKHISDENDLFQDNAFKNSVAQSIETGTDVWGEPNSVRIQQDRIKDLIETRSKDQGWSKAQKDNALLSALSELNFGVITQAVDDDNYKYASVWLKENNKQMTEEHELKAKDLIKKSGVKVQSQLAVDDYLASGLSEKEAKAEARKETGELREAQLSLITNRYGEEAQAVDRAQRSFGESARSYYADGIDAGMTPQAAYDSIPASVLENMDPGERIALQSTVRIASSGETVKTDPKVFDMLRVMADEDHEKFKELDISQYDYALSIVDGKKVRSWKDDVEIQVVRNKTQVVKQGARNAGVSDKETRRGFGDKFDAYSNRVDEELEAFQAATNKKATPKDIQDIVDRLSIEVIKRPDWWAFQGARPAVKAEIEGIPQDMIDELAFAVQESGQPVTDENIKLLYDYKFGIEPTPIGIPTYENYSQDFPQ